MGLVPAAAACEGLSPGDNIVSDGSSCTLAFLVANADGLFFMTAGHCVQVGATVTNPVHGTIGAGAFHYLVPETGQPTDGAPGDDFALIRIDPAVYDKLNPKICGWPGPSGIYDTVPGSGDVHHFGHGLVFGDLGPTTQKREGTNLRNDENFAFYWTGAGVSGDSGSAVVAADGRALGVLTHLQATVGTQATENNGGTHMYRAFQLATDGGFANLRLILDGEDPVKVLQDIRGGAAPPPGTAAPSPTPATPSPTTTPPTSKPPTSQPPSNHTKPPANTTPTGEAVDPAGDDDGAAPGATQDDKGTPGVALPLVLVALLVVALRRRR
jgi:hypothetical protein